MTKQSTCKGDIGPEGLQDDLRRLGAASVMFHQAVAERLGLNATDHKCAEVLAETGGQSAGDLAERLGLTTGGVTGVIDRLEAAGLAQRRRDLDDRRRVFVEPNVEAMSERIAPLFDSLGRQMTALLASYNADELSLISAFITRARVVIEAETRSVSSAA